MLPVECVEGWEEAQSLKLDHIGKNKKTLNKYHVEFKYFGTTTRRKWVCNVWFGTEGNILLMILDKDLGLRSDSGQGLSRNAGPQCVEISARTFVD